MKYGQLVGEMWTINNKRCGKSLKNVGNELKQWGEWIQNWEKWMW